MVARFISVRILSDQSGYIARCSFAHTVGVGKETIKLRRKGFVTAKQGNQSIRILWSKESILPSVSFTEISDSMNGTCRIVRSTPRAIFQFRADKMDGRIKIVLIIMSTFRESFSIFGLSHLICHSSNSPIVHRIFHCYRSRLMDFVGRNISFFYHIGYSLLFLVSSRSFHSLPCFFRIETGKSFQIRIGNHRHGAIARHLIGFAAHQRPDGEFILLTIDGNHRIDYMVHHFRLGDSHQRIQCTVGIPQRKSCIVGFLRIRVNHVVHSSILSIHITKKCRGNHGMIVCGIEHTSGSLIIGFYCHLLQLLVPSGGTPIHYFVKIPVGKFGLQIHRRIVTADRRKSDFYLHFFHVTKSEDTLH